jgi:hypothetical protein
VKRVIATILSVLYLVTSSGATIDFHYCIGKFIGLDISLPTNSKCSNCGMAKQNQKGCCNDKQQTLQVKKDHVLAQQVNTVSNNRLQYFTTQYSSLVNLYATEHIISSYSANNPPGLNTISPFIFNCVFRI